MLRTRDLQFSYADGKSFDFPDIDCEDGETCLILGKSGVGKTTLLHLLAGLLLPKKGSININDKDLTSISNRNMDQFRGQNIGIVFQKPHFIASISILSNLLLTQQLAGKSRDKHKILNVLEHLGIKEQAYAKPSRLSQGELQRASVARAILNNPNIILADEPTSALDDVSCEQVVKLLEKEAKELKASLLIVTHDTRLKDIVENKILLS